jgi:16S rRNA G966 N2-methylase RsmD
LQALRERLGASAIDIIAGDALAVAAGLPPRSFDIVFLDPPFDSDLLWSAIDAVRQLLAADGLIYAETDVPIEDSQAAAHGLERLRAARAGRVCFHLLRARNA